jgi:hypothetical protein
LPNHAKPPLVAAQGADMAQGGDMAQGAATPDAAPTADLPAAILTSALEALETDRRAALARLQRSARNITVACLILGVVAALTVASDFAALPLVVIVVLGFAVYGIFAAGITNQYRLGFKFVVMRSLVEAINPALDYEPADGVSEAEFCSSRLFVRPDRYSSADLVQGIVGATGVRFSEVHAETETQSQILQGSMQSDFETLFRGLFFCADFNKRFSGTTLVLPDSVERLLGHFGQSLQELGAKLFDSGLELVKLEDPAFEKQFVVYATDQIEARYLLSPALMRRLLALRSRVDVPFRLALVANTLYLALPRTDSLFDPPPLQQAIDRGCLDRPLAQLRQTLSIVDVLDLNTRIWSAPPLATAPIAAPPARAEPKPLRNYWKQP